MTEGIDFKSGEHTLYEDYNLQMQKQVKEPNLSHVTCLKFWDGSWVSYGLQF